jgi:hypothetical protein
LSEVYFTLRLPFNACGSGARFLLAHDMLKYAYHHGVKTLFLEYPEGATIQHSFKVEYVDPRGATHSKEHGIMMREYGLDSHTASAYLIALKGLKQP